MRRASLVIAQFGSFVMIFASVYFALAPLANGEFASALFIGLGGIIYWTAMFSVFGATDDYLKEKQQRPVVSAEAQPIPWNPRQGPPEEKP
ncbi:MAG: hypothetical protein GY722_06195 [bacterium]|nr:hypothetical protein [bacterium]